MRGLLGLAQWVCLIGGVVAAFNGQWLWMIVAWVGAGIVGLIGNRAVKAAVGMSETGREAMSAIPQAIELLRQGDYRAATGMTRSAVTGFRMGGDKHMLPIAFTVHAVALAAHRDLDGAEKAVSEGARLLSTVPPELAAEAADLREVQTMVQREVRNGVPDPHRLVAEFLAFNDVV